MEKSKTENEDFKDAFMSQDLIKLLSCDESEKKEFFKNLATISKTNPEAAI